MMTRAGMGTEQTREELVMVRSDKRSAEREALWAVLLEEGKDRRLGSRARLCETLDRIGRLVPPERTLAVGIESPGRDREDQVRGEPGLHVLDQPEDRGTGAAALLAALWIEAREPRATVVFLPSGDVIGEEQGGMARLTEMADFVERQPEWMILLGVQP